MEVVELQRFYSDNFDKLVKRTYNRCGNIHDAEDIVQTAFVRALKYIKSCDGMVERWFSGIIGNVYKDYQNAIRLGPVTKPLEEHLDDIAPVYPEGISPIIKKDIVLMALKEDEPARTVIRLHYEFGCTVGEIKEIVSGLTYRNIDDIIKVFRRKVLLRYK